MFLKNLSFIGFMGCGKSTTGKIIAGDLNFLFIDLDKMIEYIHELSIKDIFEKYGESYFRNFESNIINKIYNNKNCIFACGGGVFNKAENIKKIRQNSFVVYLFLTPEEAYERLKDSKDRPLLQVEGDLNQKIAQIMEERQDIYNNNCDLKINAGGKSPNRIKDEIISYLNKH